MAKRCDACGWIWPDDDMPCCNPQCPGIPPSECPSCKELLDTGIRLQARIAELEREAKTTTGKNLCLESEKNLLNKEFTKCKANLTEAGSVVDVARELRDLMQDTIDGHYKPDSFTLQPINEALTRHDATEVGL